MPQFSVDDPLFKATARAVLLHPQPTPLPVRVTGAWLDVNVHSVVGAARDFENEAHGTIEEYYRRTAARSQGMCWVCVGLPSVADLIAVFDLLFPLKDSVRALYHLAEAEASPWVDFLRMRTPNLSSTLQRYGEMEDGWAGYERPPTALREPAPKENALPSACTFSAFLQLSDGTHLQPGIDALRLPSYTHSQETIEDTFNEAKNAATINTQAGEAKTGDKLTEAPSGDVEAQAELQSPTLWQWATSALRTPLFFGQHNMLR
ncbi:hypothetical protein BU23DRAFT_564782 [Bimuria novae-zelandiae CBS 107.79]|uniref:Uncharacterized protein n=1 Tax=Bimuria novae-zelandiae CBS 107.79 TaxID=1447943 RepID=A0A6A5VM36_9PLEO|nr:hypothetical protein BU23DRAFT_564782 [Bimuria novae-zelandiae CBS 107.79]